MRKLENKELNRISVEEFKKTTKQPVILVLDNIRSMNNIGSVFRTADAFRIEEILLCGLTACPPHREIQRAALDATESVNWKYFETTTRAIDYLRSLNYRIFALEQTDEALFLQDFEYLPGDKTALIFGNEISGVDEKILPLVDGCIEIPQFGIKHSFNVSVSAGIALWHMLGASGHNKMH